MMKLLYRIAEIALSVLPKEWNNKDVQGAVLGFVAAALLIAFAWRAAPWLAQFFS